MIGALITQLFDEARRILCFKWLALSVSAAFLVAGIPVVMSLPKVYDAWAQIFVAKETPLGTAAQGVALVGDNYGNPYMVEKTLLNDENLEKVVRRLTPAAGGMTRAEMAQAIARLKSRIKVAPNADDGFFELHVRDTDAIRARETVQLLLNEFVSRNVSRNQQALQEAERFLDAQLATYQSMIAQSEARIAGFRSRNGGVATVTQETPDGSGETPTPTSAAAPATPAIGERAVIGEQVAALKAKLAALKAEYTEEYPDVIAAQRMLAEAVAKDAAAPIPPVASLPAPPPPARPVGRSRARAIARQPAAPSADWADLLRANEALHANYQQLATRREATRLSQAVYGDGKGKYQVTRSPRTPELPVGPRRGLYFAGLVAAALVGGLGVAYLRAIIAGVYVSPRDIENSLQLPVVGTVSWEPAWNTRDQTPWRLASWARTTAAAAGRSAEEPSATAPWGVP